MGNLRECLKGIPIFLVSFDIFISFTEIIIGFSIHSIYVTQYIFISIMALFFATQCILSNKLRYIPIFIILIDLIVFLIQIFKKVPCGVMYATQYIFLGIMAIVTILTLYSLFKTKKY